MAREDSISKHIGEIIVPQQFRPECSVRCGARDLAFELAGKINAELQALDWVTSPQRVTTADPADFEACGWSGQLLVRFVIRAGRLREWSQLRCGRPAAAAALAATPAGWAAFAQRSAELAAELSG